LKKRKLKSGLSARFGSPVLTPTPTANRRRARLLFGTGFSVSGTHISVYLGRNYFMQD
jgi:hypothetical protein